MRWFLLLGAASLALAQTSGTAPAAGFVPSDELNKELPTWLRFSGEYRTRVEGFDGGGGFKQNFQDAYLLSRLRLNLLLRPAKWFRIVAQAQDSRIFWNDKAPTAPPFQDTMDLRLAYAQIGSPEGPITVRVGRQELDFGEQRLIGSANWLNVPRSFDAVRATFHSGGYRLDAFSASIVVPQDGTFDHHTPGNDIHGLYGGLEKLIPNAVVEPYVFWRVAPRQKNEDGALSSLDTKTGGVRWVGKLPRGFDYGVEMVIQRGNVGANPVSAWAGHWVAGHTFKTAYAPRPFIEYNYASGDANPHDHTIGTFDQLYPTPHDRMGLCNQVAWRNIRDIHAGLEVKPRHSVKAIVAVHDLWLASATDGLYTATGALTVRVPTGAAGTHVGEELDAQALWTVNKQMQLGSGIGHIFPGDFLRRATPGNSYTFPYLMFGYMF